MEAVQEPKSRRSMLAAWVTNAAFAIVYTSRHSDPVPMAQSNSDRRRVNYVKDDGEVSLTAVSQMSNNV